ncbi:hypothetical protein FRC03_010699 [Tulasnella sp. 419]|nr:hypothetical protein FRC03_010699 [Tulasnella sp. 419]
MSSRPGQSVGDANVTVEVSGNGAKSSGGVGVNTAHPNQQDHARKNKHFEKVKVQQLTRQLVLRLQYAQLKVKHGWGPSASSSSLGPPNPSTPGPSAPRQLVPIAPAPPRPSASPIPSQSSGAAGPSNPHKHSPTGASSAAGPIRTSPSSGSLRIKPYHSPLLGVGYLTHAALLPPTSPSKHPVSNNARSPHKSPLKTKIMKATSTPSTLKAPPTASDPPTSAFKLTNGQAPPSYESFWSSMKTSSLSGGNSPLLSGSGGASTPVNGASSFGTGTRVGSTTSTITYSTLPSNSRKNSVGGGPAAGSRPLGVVANGINTDVSPTAGPGLNFYLPQPMQNSAGGTQGTSGPHNAGSASNQVQGTTNGQTTAPKGATTTSSIPPTSLFLPVAPGSTPTPGSSAVNANSFMALPPSANHPSPAAILSLAAQQANSLSPSMNARVLAFNSTPDGSSTPFTPGRDLTPTSSFNPSGLSLPPNFTASSAALGSPTRSKGAAAKRDTRIAG